MPLACCPPTKLTVQGKLVLWKLDKSDGALLSLFLAADRENIEMIVSF